MFHQDDERTQERFLQHNAVFTNNQVAGYTLIDDEVRIGFRRLYSTLESLLTGRRSKANRQPEARLIQRQAAAK